MSAKCVIVLLAAKEQGYDDDMDIYLPLGPEGGSNGPGRDC